MAHALRRLSTVGRGNVLAPSSSDASVLERQEAALFRVREKLMGRQESCSAIVLSASTLSRTIMATQMQSRGWSVTSANHLADATSIMHGQISKATARGLSVARVAESGKSVDENPQYSASGFRIKFASSDAVARLILVDCFSHEPLEEIVRHIRLLDDAYKLNTIVCCLTSPRPTEGQGFVIAPRHQLTLADAYERGADLVIPTHFGQTVVEFLTEVFLSSSGRYMKGGGTSATTSNFSQIRSLLLDVTDRNHKDDMNLQHMHSTADVTGGVPNLEGFAVASRKLGIDEDRLEDEVTEAQRREDRKRELKRQYLLQKEKAANAIDTNPEYISLLSKYEICLRQLSTYKDKIGELTTSLEGVSTERDGLLKDLTAERAESQRLSSLLVAYQHQQDTAGKERGTAAFHNQLVQREQRIAVLEKEASGYKSKFESTKKQADDALLRVERLMKENEEAKRHIVNLNKRFENRLRALGVTDMVDLDVEVEKHNEQIDSLKREADQWKCRSSVMRQRLEAMECVSLERHDNDGFGRTADLLIGGFGNMMMNKDQLRDLLNNRKAATYSTPQQGSLGSGPSPRDPSLPQSFASDALMPEVPPLHPRPPPKQHDDARMSVVSIGSLPSDEADADHASSQLMSAFAGISATQFSDMSAPATSNDSNICDVLVREAGRAISEGDAVISSVRQQQKTFADLRHRQQSESIGLGRIRASSMFADPQLQRRRLSPDAGSPPSEAAARLMTSAPSLRSEETLSSLQKISDRISTELSNLVESAELAERSDEHNRKLLESAIHDFVTLSKAAPVPTYETVLQKLRAYIVEEVQKREHSLETQAHQVRAEELERLATDFARWQVILDEVDEKLSAYTRSRESGSQDQRRKEQLEQQLDVLEAKSLRQIPELSVTRDPSTYIVTQKEIFRLRKELKLLPGGRLRAKQRGAPSPRNATLGGQAALNESTSSTGSTNALLRSANDEPLSIFEVAEKALGAQVEATRLAFSNPEAPRRAVHRRSTALAGELQSLQSIVTQSIFEGSFQEPRQLPEGSEGIEKAFGGTPADVPLSPGASQQVTSPGDGGAMHNISAEMLNRFRSYSVVKSQGATHSGGLGLKDIVGGIKTMVQAKLEAAKENVQQLAHAVDDTKHVVGGIPSSGDLNFSTIEALFDKTKDITTPTVLYQLILVYHRDVVRLLRQLRRRTSLTSVNIIDAHHLQKQLLKDNRPLTKSQADNIPFIISVDAAQVARFADYFEKETEMLVKEGISRLQRHVEEASAKAISVDLRALHVSESRMRTSSALGAPSDSLPVSRRTSRRPSVNSPGEILTALPLSCTTDDISLTIPCGDVARSANHSPLESQAHHDAQHLDAALPFHEPMSARRPSAEEVHESTIQLLGIGASSSRASQSQAQRLRNAAASVTPGARLYGTVQQAILTTTSFGACDLPSQSLGLDDQRVIYLPRTPAISQHSRPSLARKHDVTSRQRLIDDVVHKISNPPSGSLPHLPEWSSRLPPPSRQRALQLQGKQ